MSDLHAKIHITDKGKAHTMKFTYDANNIQNWTMWNDIHTYPTIHRSPAAVQLKKQKDIAKRVTRTHIYTGTASLVLGAILTVPGMYILSVILAVVSILVFISGVAYHKNAKKRNYTQYKSVNVNIRNEDVAERVVDIQKAHLMDSEGNYNNFTDAMDSEKLNEQLVAIVLRDDVKEIYDYRDILDKIKSEYMKRDAQAVLSPVMDDPMGSARDFLKEKKQGSALYLPRGLESDMPIWMK